MIQAAFKQRSNRGGSQGNLVARSFSQLAIGQNEKKKRGCCDTTSDRASPVRVRADVWPEVGLHCSPQADAHLRAFVLDLPSTNTRATARHCLHPFDVTGDFDAWQENTAVIHGAVTASETRVGQGSARRSSNLPSREKTYRKILKTIWPQKLNVEEFCVT